MDPFFSVAGRPASRQKAPPSAQLVFKGVLFDVWQWQQELPGGRTATFETLRRPDTVLVLPVLPDGNVLLAEEKQPGTPTMLRALGGRIEPGESPEQAARRELLEESGYAAERLSLWDAWQPIVKVDWAVFLFVAHGLSRLSDASLELGEAISLRAVSASALLDRDSELVIDDYELLHKLYLARSSDREYERIARLLNARG